MTKKALLETEVKISYSYTLQINGCKKIAKFTNVYKKVLSKVDLN